MGTIAYMLWAFMNKEEDCNPSYPLYPRENIPNVSEILEKILPSDWIKNGLNEGKNLSNVIDESDQKLKKLAGIFSIFDETSGSTTKRVLTSTSKIALSFGAAVLTTGAGGDKIINMPFFITKAINMILKTFTKLKNVTSKITKLLKTLTSTLKKIQKILNKTISSAENLNNHKEVINNLASNKHQITFIYDLFNVSFSGGPRHCKCWVDFIMNHYISSNERLKDIYTLLCVMNDIYIDINNEIIAFIGSALDMIIPMSMGLAGTIAPLLKRFSYVIYRGIREKLTSDYRDNIPVEIRELIQNPSTMKTYLFNKFNTYTSGSSDLLIPDNVKQFMESGIDLVANGIYKGMGMMFMFLNVFIIFSELNAGINKSLINKNINVEKLLKDCVSCNNFEIIGINSNGILNINDISNCTKCKKFFIDDEDAIINDKLLYSKCMIYRDKRDQAKESYQKLKKITIDSYKKTNISKKPKKPKKIINIATKENNIENIKEQNTEKENIKEQNIEEQNTEEQDTE